MSAMEDEPFGEINPNDQHSLAVIAYRMVQLEKNVTQLVQKFDNVAQYYVTNATLILMLDPLKERIKDLEDINKEREKNKSSEQSQFRLALVVAIVSPIISIIITVVMNTLLTQGK